MNNETNRWLQRLKNLINSDFALPVALLLLAAIIGSIERGYLNTFNGLIAVLVFLGSASFVTSLAESVTSNGEKKFSIYTLSISAIVVFTGSLGLYVNNLGKVIVVALIPGAILGILISFLSSR